MKRYFSAFCLRLKLSWEEHFETKVLSHLHIESADGKESDWLNLGFPNGKADDDAEEESLSLLVSGALLDMTLKKLFIVFCSAVAHSRLFEARCNTWLGMLGDSPAQQLFLVWAALLSLPP